MYIKPIRNDADLQDTFKRLETIFQAAEGTPEFDEMEVLVTLVEVYENKHHPINAASPECRSLHSSASSDNTLVVPSQIESTWVFLSSVGSPVSSTYPAPPKSSVASVTTSTACLPV